MGRGGDSSAGTKSHLVLLTPGAASTRSFICPARQEEKKQIVCPPKPCAPGEAPRVGTKRVSYVAEQPQAPPGDGTSVPSKNKPCPVERSIGHIRISLPDSYNCRKYE